MMPLWIDLGELTDDEVAQSWDEWCPMCLEPWDFCECGYVNNYDESEDEDE